MGWKLEEMGNEALGRCTSLQCIVIPHALKVVYEKSFYRSPNITDVVFCDKIEEFVKTTESMQGWWNHGLHEKCLKTYHFLLRCSVPELWVVSLSGDGRSTYTNC
jgi:hypothetical protein